MICWRCHRSLACSQYMRKSLLHWISVAFRPWIFIYIELKRNLIFVYVYFVILTMCNGEVPERRPRFSFKRTQLNREANERNQSKVKWDKRKKKLHKNVSVCFVVVVVVWHSGWWVSADRPIRNRNMFIRRNGKVDNLQSRSVDTTTERMLTSKSILELFGLVIYFYSSLWITNLLIRH